MAGDFPRHIMNDNKMQTETLAILMGSLTRKATNNFQSSLTLAEWTVNAV